MIHKLNCVMLVDENDNFFHEKAIIDNALTETVIVQNSTKKALEYLKSKTDPYPTSFFLHINMPGITGWEFFLDEYRQLEYKIKAKSVIIMLSTSANSQDKAKAKTWYYVSDYITKPLKKETMGMVMEKYF